MKILTVNNIPICVSNNVDLLIKRKDEIINKLKNDSTLTILFVEENTISYNTGISYITDCFEINDIEVLN